jgi:hypothetical protein
MKLKYKIMKSVVYAPILITYFIPWKMRKVLLIWKNKQNTKMEFLYPNNHIYLTVGNQQSCN